MGSAGSGVMSHPSGATHINKEAIMREIEFRGKRIDNGKWVYGYYWSVDSSHYIKQINTSGSYGGFEDFLIFKDFLIDVNTLGQFIGVLDIIATRIYYGDIVKFREYNMLVEFKKGCFGFKHCNEKNCSIFITDFIDVELIGNKTENPELLKDN